MRILKVDVPSCCPFRHEEYEICAVNDVDCESDDLFPADCPLRKEPVFVEKEVD